MVACSRREHFFEKMLFYGMTPLLHWKFPLRSVPFRTKFTLISCLAIPAPAFFIMHKKKHFSMAPALPQNRSDQEKSSVFGDGI
jgi:hypothetical protein